MNGTSWQEKNVFLLTPKECMIVRSVSSHARFFPPLFISNINLSVHKPIQNHFPINLFTRTCVIEKKTVQNKAKYTVITKSTRRIDFTPKITSVVYGRP